MLPGHTAHELMVATHWSRYFDALQLEMLCGTPPPPAATHPDAAVEGSEEGFPPTNPYDAGGLGLHVHPTAGSDTKGDGSPGHPFRSLARCLAAARLAKQVRQGATPPPIVLHAGVHFLNETLVLGPQDSGQVITAAPGEEAWISGGILLQSLDWKPHKGSVYVAKLDHKLANVPALYTVSPHKRLTRARYPNGDWETDQWGWCSTIPCLALTCRGNVDSDPGLSCPRYGGPNSITGANAIPGGHSDSVVQWWQPAPKTKPKQFTGPLGNCSQPGNCTTYLYTSGQGGPCDLWDSCDSDPSNKGASYWCGDHASGGGAGNDRQMVDGSLSIPIGVTYNITKPELERFAQWTDARGAVVHGAHIDSSVRWSAFVRKTRAFLLALQLQPQRG